MSAEALRDLDAQIEAVKKAITSEIENPRGSSRVVRHLGNALDELTKARGLIDWADVVGAVQP